MPEVGVYRQLTHRYYGENVILYEKADSNAGELECIDAFRIVLVRRARILSQHFFQRKKLFGRQYLARIVRKYYTCSK